MVMNPMGSNPSKITNETNRKGNKKQQAGDSKCPFWDGQVTLFRGLLVTSNDRGSKAHDLNHLGVEFFLSIPGSVSFSPPSRVSTRRLGRIQLENGNTFLGAKLIRRLEGTGFCRWVFAQHFFWGKKRQCFERIF